MTIEAISPSLIIIHPPEKLVLEIKTAGRYSSIEWRKNGIVAGQSSFPVSAQSFAQFGEVYVVENTATEDLGVYDVILNPAPHSNQSTPAGIRFTVLPLGTELYVFVGWFFSVCSMIWSSRICLAS